MVIKFRVGGKSYSYDEGKLMISAAIAVEEHIGGTVMDWQQGLLDGRADCYQALGWLVLRGGDPDVPIGDVDCPMMKLADPYLKAKMRTIAGLAAVIEKAKAAGSESDSEPLVTSAGSVTAAGDAGEAA